jgi:tetratricopeptide (TPR) repeat protein
MDVAKAVTVYAKLEALDPEYKKDNRDAAKAMLDKSLKEEAAAASPVTPPAKGSYSDYNKAGSNALKQLQYKAAIACFDKMAAQAEGTKAVALASNRLGWAYICDRQYKNAIAPLSTACRLDPANKLYAKNLGYACKEAYLADETQGADLVLKAKDAFTKAEDTDNMGWVDDTLKSYPEAVTPTAAAATEMSTPVEKSPKTAPAGVTSSAK